MINENGETVQVIVQPDDGQFMLAGQAGGAAGEQAIMVGPDGTIVNTNNQVRGSYHTRVPFLDFKNYKSGCVIFAFFCQPIKIFTHSLPVRKLGNILSNLREG